MKSKALEWFGVVTPFAIMYSMLVAFNIGVEFTGFLLLLVSASFSIGYWAPAPTLVDIKGYFYLQFFYATAIGDYYWYG